MEIRKIVDETVQKYGTRSPYELADLKDIYISHHNLGCINGYFCYAYGIKQIVLNKNLEKSMEEYVLAHEIGHEELHGGINEPFIEYNTNLSIGKIENEADKFAVELLLSDDMLHEYKDYTVVQLSKLFGLPERLIEIRLKK